MRVSFRLRSQSSAVMAALLFVAATGTPAGAQRQVSDSSVGYIDNAIPGDLIRLRFDAAWGNEFPDRAEFFYGKCGCFRELGIDPDAPGPPEIETNVDYQDLATHAEFSLADRLSVFAEFPVRFLDPEQNDNTTGFADMNVGFKLAFYQDDCSVATFQMRAYLPTGDADRGLGTDHYSVEPGLLVFSQLSDRLIFEGEVRDWIPIDGTEDWAGNVLRYGAGLGYVVHQSCECSITPIVELVGWSVLDGKKFDGEDLVIRDASGDTIVNVKLGVRFSFGGPTLLAGERSSLYVGYGRALTSEVWYEDVARVEYRVTY